MLARLSESIGRLSPTRSAARYGNTRQVHKVQRDADKARDSKQWDIAAEKYASVLAVTPAEGEIWVQYGNVSKERSDFAEAEKAYLAAEMLFKTQLPKSTKDLADVYLQFGHLRKRQARIQEATDFYLKSLDHYPDRPDARRELLAFGYSRETIEAWGKRTDPEGMPDKREPKQPTRGTDVAPAGAGVTGAPLGEEQRMGATDLSEEVDLDCAILRASEFFRTASREQIEELHRRTWERIHAEEGDIPELKNWFPKR